MLFISEAGLYARYAFAGRVRIAFVERTVVVLHIPLHNLMILPTIDYTKV